MCQIFTDVMCKLTGTCMGLNIMIMNIDTQILVLQILDPPFNTLLDILAGNAMDILSGTCEGSAGIVFRLTGLYASYRVEKDPR